MTRSTLCLALLALGLAPAIAGCDEQIQREREPTFGPAFGNAVQNNLAVQIINPVPPAATVAPDYTGRRAVSAIERYRNGNIIPPPSTSIGGVGGGGGGGGGGAGASGGGGAAPAQ